jgi:penicillin-binding protein 2
MDKLRRISGMHEIAPDEIFLDSSNLPLHEISQFEGRVVKPVASYTILAVGLMFFIIASLFGGRAFYLQVAQGNNYAEISRNNTLNMSLLFATRGVIYDRTGREIAWNSISSETSSSTKEIFALRQYIDMPGLSHVLGFIQYPKADKAGTWWREEYTGASGVELSLDPLLQGKNGSQITEADARGRVQRTNMIEPPQNGSDVTLSINADIQSQLYTILSQHARENKFDGGAAVIMNVKTGEIVALTSFPEYDHSAFNDGISSVVRAAYTDPRTPLLNRAISGLYAPGSIVKPIFAAAALNEGIISPNKIIISTGAISIPNPYDPTKPSLFHDWTVHGPIDMRTALAVSSDEYFYTIGGGYGGQSGLGIARIDEYARKFGLGSTTGIALRGEVDGVIPTPAWKSIAFPDDPTWRIGDTYHTAIGQYGFQVTPIQAVRYIAAIANGGKLMIPQLLASSTPQFTEVGIPDEYLKIVREGMRMAVTSDRPDATVKSLYIGGIAIAAKTGTAQIGNHNQWMNSWSVGFWPADDPKYAYAVVLEHAPAGTPSGAAPGMQPFFYWLIANHPEYVN